MKPGEADVPGKEALSPRWQERTFGPFGRLHSVLILSAECPGCVLLQHVHRVTLSPCKKEACWHSSRCQARGLLALPGLPLCQRPEEARRSKCTAVKREKWSQAWGKRKPRALGRPAVAWGGITWASREGGSDTGSATA